MKKLIFLILFPTLAIHGWSMDEQNGQLTSVVPTNATASIYDGVIFFNVPSIAEHIGSYVAGSDAYALTDWNLTDWSALNRCCKTTKTSLKSQEEQFVEASRVHYTKKLQHLHRMVRNLTYYSPRFNKDVDEAYAYLQYTEIRNQYRTLTKTIGRTFLNCSYTLSRLYPELLNYDEYFYPVMVRNFIHEHFPQQEKFSDYSLYKFIEDEEQRRGTVIPTVRKSYSKLTNHKIMNPYGIAKILNKPSMENSRSFVRTARHITKNAKIWKKENPVINTLKALPLKWFYWELQNYWGEDPKKTLNMFEIDSVIHYEKEAKQLNMGEEFDQDLQRLIQQEQEILENLKKSNSIYKELFGEIVLLERLKEDTLKYKAKRIYEEIGIKSASLGFSHLLEQLYQYSLNIQQLNRPLEEKKESLFKRQKEIMDRKVDLVKLSETLERLNLLFPLNGIQQFKDKVGQICQEMDYMCLPIDFVSEHSKTLIDLLNDEVKTNETLERINQVAQGWGYKPMGPEENKHSSSKNKKNK